MHNSYLGNTLGLIEKNDFIDACEMFVNVLVL